LDRVNKANLKRHRIIFQHSLVYQPLFYNILTSATCPYLHKHDYTSFPDAYFPLHCRNLSFLTALVRSRPSGPPHSIDQNPSLHWLGVICVVHYILPLCADLLTLRKEVSRSINFQKDAAMTESDYNRRNRVPRPLSDSEKARLDEFIDSIHYSARSVKGIA